MPKYQAERREYLQGLTNERHEQARKRDRKAYDAFWKATFARLFPTK